MTNARTRKLIRLRQGVTQPATLLSGVHSFSGVRVYDVGQGDSIAVLDGRGVPVVQIDYGGKQDNPFKVLTPAQVDARMPVALDCPVLITHWDEDHWCMARKGAQLKDASWLVPRQVTSPRAVRFSLTLRNARCIPETQVGNTFSFIAENGDTLLWQKIAKSKTNARQKEDCNKTGVSLALVQNSTQRCILLPGDAAFDTVPLYHHLSGKPTTLVGLVAFHHGSGEHWTKATRKLLKNWRKEKEISCQVAFSCAEDNSYGHPQPDNYKALFPVQQKKTFDLRKYDRQFADILFPV